MSRYWYGYVGGATGDPFDPADYLILPNQDAPGVAPCLTGAQICAIYAPSGDVIPDSFSPNLTQYITNAVSATNSPQPVGAGLKKYLYKRSAT